MKVKTLGNKNNPAILLIPGTCCHWTIFNDVIPLLEKKFLRQQAGCVRYDLRQ